MKIDFEIFLLLLNRKNQGKEGFVSFEKLMKAVKSIPSTEAKLNTLLARLEVMEKFCLVELLKDSTSFPVAIRITTKGQKHAA